MLVWVSNSTPMSRPAILLKKNFILFHRWMGVAFSVLFLFWFLSGFVMMYWDYPEVNARDRIAHGEKIRWQDVRVSPAAAFVAAGLEKPPTRVRLTMLDGKPVYRFHSGRLQNLVSAETGQRVAGIGQEAALRIAAAWTGHPAAEAHFEGAMTEEDQWTLNKSVRPLRPFLKFRWPDGEEVYVSQVTGEVMQHTTSKSRLMGYLGAVTHWLYFTPLRKETGLWRVVVIWLSAAGSIMTLLGIVVGIWLYSPSRRYRFPAGASSIPYSGWKRWHTIVGLVFGLTTFTWILSGMFSMNPNQWSPEFGPWPDLQSCLSGPQAGPVLYPQPLSPGPAAGDWTEVELLPYQNQPLVVATAADGRRWRFHALTGQPAEASAESILAPLHAAGYPVAEWRWVRQYESYYLDRHGRKPLPVLYVRLSDADSSIHYIDPVSARFVESYDRKTRWNRWLYHGLHSLDLPWLYANRPAWDATVLALMLGGTALCVTSVWIAVVRLRRKLALQRI